MNHDHLIGKLLFTVLIISTSVVLSSCGDDSTSSLPPISPIAKTYGEGKDDRGFSLIKLRQGGYVVAGGTDSFGGSDPDILLVKFDENGNVLGEGTFGGTGQDVAYSIQEVSGGGFIVAGYTSSFGAGQLDFWILRLNENAAVIWEKTYGGTGDEVALPVRELSSGGFIVVGPTDSFGSGKSDIWVIKLDSSGNIVWEKAYGASDNELPYAVRELSSGGYLIAGYTDSSGAGDKEGFLIWLNNDGSLWLRKTYGDSGAERFRSVEELETGDLIVTGHTGSFGGSSFQGWVLKLDNVGKVIWEKAYGGSGDDYFRSIKPLASGDLIVTGYTGSYGAGADDIWLVRLNSEGSVLWSKAYGGTNDEQGYFVENLDSRGFIFGGKATSYGAGGDDIWIVKTDASGELTSSLFPNISSNTSTTVDDTNAYVSPPPTTNITNTSASVNNTNATVNSTSIIVNQQAP